MKSGEIQRFFDSIPALDWVGDPLGTGRLAEQKLRELASNKALFRELLEAVLHNQSFWQKCEEDLVEDKIVLWDDQDKGLHLRLRMATAPQQSLAHSHRFSFTNLVLRGRYVHWQYRPLAGFNELTNLDEVKEVLMMDEKAGDCFTIHHEALHSTPFTEHHTISLVLRGNPVKRRAPVMFKEPRGRQEAISNIRGMDHEPGHALPGDMFWRVGEEEESAERRKECRMSLERYSYWLRTLAVYELI
ncbi:MAG: hypothetical protein M3Q07_16720 [Pseudobdellovibrionaceae bacterium]|nr:hypothetical protein [Pseudobdellovibrionaceae bacterium]